MDSRLPHDEYADEHVLRVTGALAVTRDTVGMIYLVMHMLRSVVLTFALAYPKSIPFPSNYYNVLQEFNDSLSVTYLASVQKSAGSVNDLADKFMTAFGHRRAI